MFVEFAINSCHALSSFLDASNQALHCDKKIWRDNLRQDAPRCRGDPSTCNDAHDKRARV